MSSHNPYDLNNLPTPSATESRILTTYLLHPSPLPTFLTLPQFTALFPRPQQSHPHIRSLYRDLQFQRNLDVETVRANIEREVGRGPAMRRQLLRQVIQELRDSDGAALSDPFNNQQAQPATGNRKQNEDGTNGDYHIPSPEGSPTDVAIDVSILGNGNGTQLGNLPSHSATTYHTLPSLVSAMSAAVHDLELETASYQQQADEIVAEMREVVGGLSDLRYGKFARTSGVAERGMEDDDEGIEMEVEEGLKRLIDVCEMKGQGGS